MYRVSNAATPIFSSAQHQATQEHPKLSIWNFRVTSLPIRSCCVSPRPPASTVSLLSKSSSEPRERIVSTSRCHHQFPPFLLPPPAPSFSLPRPPSPASALCRLSQLRAEVRQLLSSPPRLLPWSAGCPPTAVAATVSHLFALSNLEMLEALESRRRLAGQLLFDPSDQSGQPVRLPVRRDRCRRLTAESTRAIISSFSLQNQGTISSHALRRLRLRLLHSTLQIGRCRLPHARALRHEVLHHRVEIPAVVALLPQ
jgi:hypothetical protein